MEKPFYTMKPQLRGQLRYPAAALVCALPFALFDGIRGFLVLFLAMTMLLAFFKNHSIVVFDGSLTEKDHLGRFVRKVPAERIHHYRRNFLGEITLIDADSKPLLCVEPHMTNRDRFEQWLKSHNIESK